MQSPLCFCTISTEAVGGLFSAWHYISDFIKEIHVQRGSDLRPAREIDNDAQSLLGVTDILFGLPCSLTTLPGSYIIIND